MLQSYTEWESQSGGRGKHKLLEKWKHTVWVIELTKVEIPVASRKRQSESVVETKTKLTRLEGELKESKAKLRDATNQIHLLEQSTKKLSYALAESGTSTGMQTCRKKCWSEYSKRYKWKRKKTIATTALKFVEDDCFDIKNVVLTNKETGEEMSIKEGEVTEIVNEKIPDKELTKKDVIYQRQIQLVKPSIS